jgi:N-acetylmuramoyl-L-alanine amidase
MMQPLITGWFLYLLKSVLISGLLYGYYRLFLRNRVFHQYNRYYLLGVAPVSLILPLIPLPSGYRWEVMDRAPALSGAFHAITPGDWKEPAAVVTDGSIAPLWLNGQYLVIGIYLLTALTLLYLFFRQLRYIWRLPGKYPMEKKGRIRLFMTREAGAPFSFLRNIFWDDQLDIESDRGRQVFAHESYHVRQRHTLDLLLLRPLLICFFPNPFFHLIYREIKTIHEFQADGHALSDGDRYQYAELLVWQAVSSRHSSLLHPFFHTSIKRRITMITQFKTATPGLTSRMMVLPLLIAVLCAFSGRLRPRHATSASRDIVHQPYTVVIDAGHGGIDAGAIAPTGIAEKGINLALALKVKQLSPEYHVNVVLTREDDQLAGGKKSIRESLVYRTEVASASKADLFVSLHTDADAAGGENQHGFNVYVSPDNQHYSQCVRLGSALIDALKGSYATGPTLMESKQGVYVLRASAMPAVLILCGNISNPQDLAFIGSEANQEKIARDILQGIVRYEEAKGAEK